MPAGKYRVTGHYTLHPHLVFSDDVDASGTRFRDLPVPIIVGVICCWRDCCRE